VRRTPKAADGTCVESIELEGVLPKRTSSAIKVVDFEVDSSRFISSIAQLARNKYAVTEVFQMAANDLDWLDGDERIKNESNEGEPYSESDPSAVAHRVIDPLWSLSAHRSPALSYSKFKANRTGVA
jgi:hypothetical protein